MARKPDAPCAGECGTMLWSTATSLPEGQRTCRPCRRAGRGPITDRACAVCGGLFRPNDHKNRKQLTCSRRCGSTARLAKLPTLERAQRQCGSCDTVVTLPRVYCEPCVGVRRLAHYQRKNLTRRAAGEPVSIAELGERDRWRCHLCRQRVNPAVRWPHPRSASRDHLVPVADGGTNDPSNLALAHLRCNVRRGTRGVVQLQLVG